MPQIVPSGIFVPKIYTVTIQRMSHKPCLNITGLQIGLGQLCKCPNTYGLKMLNVNRIQLSQVWTNHVIMCIIYHITVITSVSIG